MDDRGGREKGDLFLSHDVRVSAQGSPPSPFRLISRARCRKVYGHAVAAAVAVVLDLDRSSGGGGGGAPREIRFVLVSSTDEPSFQLVGTYSTGRPRLPMAAPPTKTLLALF